MNSHKYEARCWRTDHTWVAEIPQLRVNTCGRSLREAQTMARDAAALVLNTALEDVSVSLTVASPHLDALRKARAAAKAATSTEAAAAAAEDQALARAVQDLLAQGATRKDTARAAGTSPRRVSQIAHSTASPTRQEADQPEPPETSITAPR